MNQNRPGVNATPGRNYFCNSHNVNIFRTTLDDMKTQTAIMPVATSDFVTKKNHGQFMSERIDRLQKWVGRNRWPGTLAMWVVEDLQSASNHVENHRWNDAHEMLVGALLGLRFTVDEVATAEQFLDNIATLEQWIHTIKSDIQRMIP